MNQSDPQTDSAEEIQKQNVESLNGVEPIMYHNPYERLQEAMLLSRLPKALQMLRKMEIPLDQINAVIHSDPKRYADESFEDYKVRRWLQNNIIKFRHNLEVYEKSFIASSKPETIVS